MSGQFPTFELERYFAEYEFKVKHQLSCSDGEALMADDLLKNADNECKRLWTNMSLAYTG